MTAYELTKKLISIDSTDPGNFEGNIAAYIYDLLSHHSPSIKLSRQEVKPGRYNIPASIAYDCSLAADQISHPVPLVILSHMDTVPVGHEWTKPALVATQEDDLLYGRGACDMKSGLACAIAAFCHAADKVASGCTLTRPLQFACTVDEECFMEGAQMLFSSGFISPGSMIYDTEPTSCQLQTGHKGRVWYKLTMHGVASHASRPESGVDAIAAMSEAITYIKKAISDLPSDSYFGDTSVCFGSITGGVVEYAVPDTCTVTIDIRPVYPTTTADITSIIDQAVRYAAERIPGSSATYVITGDRPAVPSQADSILCRSILEVELAMSDALTRSTSLTKSQQLRYMPRHPEAFTGYTDSAVLHSLVEDITCASWGPGDLAMAHKADEYVSIRDIEYCEASYKLLIDKLCF